MTESEITTSIIAIVIFLVLCAFGFFMGRERAKDELKEKEKLKELTETLKRYEKEDMDE